MPDQEHKLVIIGKKPKQYGFFDRFLKGKTEKMIMGLQSNPHFCASEIYSTSVPDLALETIVDEKPVREDIRDLQYDNPTIIGISPSSKCGSLPKVGRLNHKGCHSLDLFTEQARLDGWKDPDKKKEHIVPRYIILLKPIIEADSFTGLYKVEVDGDDEICVVQRINGSMQKTRIAPGKEYVNKEDILVPTTDLENPNGLLIKGMRYKAFLAYITDDTTERMALEWMVNGEMYEMPTPTRLDMGKPLPNIAEARPAEKMVEVRSTADMTEYFRNNGLVPKRV